MSYDPSIVGRYGNIAEKWAAERYPLSLDYPVVDGLKFDATARDGRPFDIKSCMVNGVRPTFKFWDDQHRVLADNSGGYVLVWYEARETEISVKESRSLSAESIKITNWTNPGETHYRSHAREAQIPADRLRP